MKNLLLTRELSVMDDRIGPPATREPADLGDLLSTVAERLDHDGVLLLDAHWARYVAPYAAAGGPDGTSRRLQAGEWTANVMEGDTWIRWTNSALVSGGRGYALWTAEIDAIPPRSKSDPLIEPDPILTAMNLHQWQDVTGAPWVGTPGMAGNALLIDGWKSMNPRSPEPYWSGTGIMTNEGLHQWPFGPIEMAYSGATWSRDYDEPMHGYDLNMAYLSAYAVAELAADQLKHYRRALDFDPRQAGIWRVDLSPWTYEHLLPDPAGYAPANEDGTRWLTTPTLTLLQELTDRGDYAGFTVREAWTAPARRITRKWAELLRDVAGAARDPLGTAAKQAYKQTYGMWARGGRVRRPDWHYAIIAQNRVNLWRKLDQARRGAHPNLSWNVIDRQPLIRVETDCAFYGGITDWERDAPHGFRLDPSGWKLGHFKPYEPKGER